jgi:hypothetical protein
MFQAAVLVSIQSHTPALEGSDKCWTLLCTDALVSTPAAYHAVSIITTPPCGKRHPSDTYYSDEII